MFWYSKKAYTRSAPTAKTAPTSTGCPSSSMSAASVIGPKRASGLGVMAPSGRGVRKAVGNNSSRSPLAVGEGVSDGGSAVLTPGVGVNVAVGGGGVAGVGEVVGPTGGGEGVAVGKADVVAAATVCVGVGVGSG